MTAWALAGVLVACSSEPSSEPMAHAARLRKATASVACEAESTLAQLVTCISEHMPQNGSNGFIAPSPNMTTAFRGVVRRMLDGECQAIVLGTELAAIARVLPFTDASNGRSYCVFLETEDADQNGFVDHGLGTTIVDANAERELSHVASHARSDIATEDQAIALFRDTRGRAFVASGVTRFASDAPSPCQSGFAESDAAHDDRHFVQAATAELAAWYGARPFHVIQWHGMAATTCPKTDAYLTYGLAEAPPPGSKLVELRDRMRAAHPTWSVEVAGSKPSCIQNGTQNIQGRLLNGVASPCTTAATSASGTFLHIEQQPGFRSAADWLDAVRATFGAAETVQPPSPPTGISLAIRRARIHVSWTASVGATSYRVLRREGASSTTIATTSGTNHRDTTVIAGQTYCYAIIAENAAGESAPSEERCGVAR